MGTMCVKSRHSDQRWSAKKLISLCLSLDINAVFQSKVYFIVNYVLILESNVSFLSAIDSPSAGFQWRNISIASLRLTPVPNP